MVKIADFYSVRQWHANGMYADVLLAPWARIRAAATPARAARGLRRLYLCRPSAGPDFSERDRALLTLPHPHLYQAYLAAERRRASASSLTPRGDAPAAAGGGGGTVNTPGSHQEDIHVRLQVSSRTSAALHASP